MKKLKYLLFAFLLMPVVAHANIYHCSAPGSVESGQSFSVTFYGHLDSEFATWTGKIGSEGNVRYSSGETNIWYDGGDFSRTINYVAGNPGSATFYVYDVDVSDENGEYLGSDSCTVSIVEASKPSNNSNISYNQNRSSNNNLKSITIENVKLTPEFNKDTLEYKGVVSGDIEKINIQAELEDDKGVIEGLGEKELVEGKNTFEIRVRAENDEEKVYIIEITRKEKNPIEIIINKKKYTVFKKESNIEIPKGFIKTNVVIQKQDVVAYSNKFLDNVLVLLVDEDGNSDFYIYNSKNSTYIKYNEINSGNTRLVILKPNNKDIPSNFKKTTIKINKEEIDAYYIKGISNFKYIYAINMNNGEKSFYQYDSDEKTFQRYNSKMLSSIEEFSEKIEIGLVASGAVILILIIIIISLSSNNRKFKKVIKNRKEQEKVEEIIKKEKEVKDNPKEKKEEVELSKKEKKKKDKEEKKKLKEMQDDFLR